MLKAMQPSASRRTVTIALVIVAMIGTGCRSAADVVAPIDQPENSAAPIVGRFATLTVSTTAGVPIVSRDLYVTGNFLLSSADSVPLAQGTLEIKGRGNSTWSMPKKPYRLKLTSSTVMLGMPANRHWALLANYADKTLMRNAVAFELSRQLEMAYTPRAEWVHLRLNGRDEGLYQLAEHVRLGVDRVNVPELKVSDTTAVAITGGYLLEIDETRGEVFCFNGARTKSMVYCAKSPETLLDPGWEKHRAYITGYMAAVDSVIFSPQFADPSKGYAAYIDVPSAIDYFLVNEIVKNVDGNLRRSTFLYKPRSGKLFFGPVWDFDLALGNVNYDGADRTDGWHVRTAPWYARLFQDPAFAARVKSRWQQLKGDGTIPRLQQYINGRWDYLSVAQQRNFQRWPILNVWVWPNRVVTGSYDGEVATMKSWLGARVNWMDAELSPSSL